MKKTVKFISVVLCFALIMCFFAGCSETSKVEKTVSNAFDAMKISDLKTAQQYFEGSDADVFDLNKSNTDESQTEYLKSFFGKLEYKILSSEKIDESNANVKVEITNVDMTVVLPLIMGEAFKVAFSGDAANSDKVINDLMIKEITKEDAKMLTSTVDIKAVKVEDDWKIKADDVMANAVFGGLLNAGQDLSNQFGGVK